MGICRNHNSITNKTRRVAKNPKLLLGKDRKLTKRLKGIIRQFIVKVLKIFINKYVINLIETIYEEYVNNQQKELINRFQSCGYGVRINGKITIHNPINIVVGNNVHIGKGCFFSAKGGLTIGDNTHISRNVTIYTSNHNYKGKALPYDHLENPKPVSIGKNVWIGMNVCITPGVRIGEGAIIGLGSVISQDVPPGSIVGSAPQRLIKTRERGHYEKLVNGQKYGGINGHVLTNDELTKFKQHPFQKGKDLFFVLSNDRSGTMTIAQALSQHPEIKCMHEGRPQLIRLSTELAHQNKTAEQVKQELMDIYYTSVVSGDIYGESNQKFWNLVPIMNTLFPLCKFIWLIRDGRDVVASTYSRGWYSLEQKEQGHPTQGTIKPWYYYRLNGANCGCFNQKQWDSLSVFEKNCWYWSYVNKIIEQELDKLPTERWTKIHLEDFEKELVHVVEFLGAQPHPLKVMRTDTSDNKLRRWDRWSELERKQFKDMCGEQMDKNYPNWSDCGF
jgi:acetyltransferase-like isoleucine patch superfamily enzyme